MSGREDLRHYEDVQVGESAEFGRYEVTAEEIRWFAERYDPQPFHLDEAAAAQSIYGGLIASGWHTSAMMMNMLCAHKVGDSASIGSPGFRDLAWLRPVRAGDVLRVRSECIEKAPHPRRPDCGFVNYRTEVVNQQDEVVLRVTTSGLWRRRHAG